MKGRLGELARLFLRLGFTAFGGPAAHIALMEEEVVTRRQWLTREDFLDLVGATNLIPGPNSTELAIHIGHRRAGWAGLLVAGTCFIIPAVAITTLLAWGYTRFGTIPAAQGPLGGIKAVMVAIVLQALWRLGRTALKSKILITLAVLAAVAAALGVAEIAVLLGAGVIAAATLRPPASALAVSPSLFLVFAKIGSLLFGSGYVLLAFLRTELVVERHWLTEAQLVDAIAAGQVTPGPVFTTATFVGYLIDGGWGAAAATLGIFLPAFVFVALSGPLLPRIRTSPRARSFLDGVNAASLALMAVVTARLGLAVLIDVRAAIIGAIALVLLVRWRVGSTWLVVGGAAAGAALHLL